MPIGTDDMSVERFWFPVRNPNIRQYIRYPDGDPSIVRHVVNFVVRLWRSLIV